MRRVFKETALPQNTFFFFFPTPASQTDQTREYKAEPPQQAQEVCAFVREVEVVAQSKQGTRKKKPTGPLESS